jgi:hypothetical protein
MKRTILLFEDNDKQRDEVNRTLMSVMQGEGEVKNFIPGVGGVKGGTHEVRLAQDIQTSPNVPTDLIVADRDLSGYAEHYRGLSEDTVRHVADMLGLPHCGYARGDRDDDPDFVKRGDEREACIRLSLKPSVERFAARVTAIADGFLTIADRLDRYKAMEKVSPGKLLASILGKPEYADKISLYASGDQNRLASAHRVRSSSPEEQKRRTACLLGYWLWDSVLRFPGVTVGEIPASSYLNIRQDVFLENAAVSDIFAPAIYDGPFAGAKVRMWWRGMLDDIVADSAFLDGRAMASASLGWEVPRSECCEDFNKPAGYYCILSERPVSLENSEGGLSWFPRGADLTRVCRSKLEELGPWL